MKIFKKIAAIALGITALAGITACSIITPDTKNTEPAEHIAAIEESYTEPVSEDILDTDIIVENTEDITPDDIADISDNTDIPEDTDYSSETDDIYTESDDTETSKSDYTEKYTNTQPETFIVSDTTTIIPKETTVTKITSPEPDLIKSEDTITEDYKVKSNITYETSNEKTSTVTVTYEGDDQIPVIPDKDIDIAATLPTVVATETVEYLETTEEDTIKPTPNYTVIEEEAVEKTTIKDNNSDNLTEEAVKESTDKNDTTETIIKETTKSTTENNDIVKETIEETVIEDNIAEKTSEKITVEKEAIVEDNTVKETVVEDTIIKDNTITKEPVANEILEDTTIEEKTANDTVVENTQPETIPEEPEIQEETTTILYTPSYELSPEATELYSWIVDNTLNPAGDVSYTKDCSYEIYNEATDAVEHDYFKYSEGPFTGWSRYTGITLDSNLSHQYMLKDEFIRTNIQNIENQIFYEGISQEDAIAAINNWFKTNYSYKYDIYDMYTAFENKGGVCMTYALIAQALCNDVGIDCYYVTGEADNGIEKGGHAWNKVNVNGKWYYIDFTWNTSPKYYLSESLWEDHWEAGCQKLFV